MVVEQFKNHIVTQADKISIVFQEHFTIFLDVSLNVLVLLLKINLHFTYLSGRVLISFFFGYM